MSLGIYANPSITTDGSGIAMFGFVVPVGVWARQRVELDLIFQDACTTLEADQGYAGLTITDRAAYYDDGSRELDDNRRAEVMKLIQAYPGLDLHYLDADALRWLGYGSPTTPDPWGLRWPAYTSFIGTRWQSRLGSLETFVCSLELAGVTTSLRSAGVLIVAGAPSLDGAALRSVAAATKAARLRPEFPRGQPFLQHLAASGWMTRFEQT